MPDAPDIEIDEKPLANPYVKTSEEETRKQRKFVEWQKLRRLETDKEAENTTPNK